MKPLEMETWNLYLDQDQCEMLANHEGRTRHIDNSAASDPTLT